MWVREILLNHLRLLKFLVHFHTLCQVYYLSNIWTQQEMQLPTQYVMSHLYIFYMLKLNSLSIFKVYKRILHVLSSTCKGLEWFPNYIQVVAQLRGHQHLWNAKKKLLCEVTKVATNGNWHEWQTGHKKSEDFQDSSSLHQEIGNSFLHKQDDNAFICSCVRNHRLTSRDLRNDWAPSKRDLFFKPVSSHKAQKRPFTKGR